jgi:hypothetical protein
MLTNYINLYYFIISLCIGFFFVYILTPTPDIVLKYPTPNNAGKVIYKDKADVCYKYKVNEVDCPDDKSKVVNQKIQHINDNNGHLDKFHKLFSK